MLLTCHTNHHQLHEFEHFRDVAAKCYEIGCSQCTILTDKEHITAMRFDAIELMRTDAYLFVVKGGYALKSM